MFRIAPVAAVVVLPLALVLSGCSGASDAVGRIDHRYEQTWTASYGKTTCRDWSERMTSAQRWAGAAQMLFGGREVDGGEGLPPERLVVRFTRAMSKACASPAARSTTIDEVGQTVYAAGRDGYRPAATG